MFKLIILAVLLTMPMVFSKAKAESFPLLNNAHPQPGNAPATNSTITTPEPLADHKAENDAVQAVMEVPKFLDSALGQFKINDVSCSLKYSYSTLSLDPFAEQKPKVEIILTAEPISAKAFNVTDGFEKIFPDKQCWVYIEFENSKSLGAIKAFIPGQEKINAISPRQTSIKKQIDLQEDVLGATFSFKEPLVSGNAKVTGQFSLRTHFRQFAESKYAILSRGTYDEKLTTAPYKAYLAEYNVDEKTRSVASIPDQNAPTTTNKIDAKLLPQKIDFSHAFVNSKAKKTVLVMHGTYSQEQIASGLTITKPDPSNPSERTVYGMIVMQQQQGQWVKEEEKWMLKLPQWAYSHSAPENKINLNPEPKTTLGSNKVQPMINKYKDTAPAPVVIETRAPAQSDRKPEPNIEQNPSQDLPATLPGPAQAIPIDGTQVKPTSDNL